MSLTRNYSSPSGMSEMKASGSVDNSIRTRLEMELANLTQRKAEVERAIELLEKNPDIEELINLVR
jgi:hypothetical protein